VRRWDLATGRECPTPGARRDWPRGPQPSVAGGRGPIQRTTGRAPGHRTRCSPIPPVRRPPPRQLPGVLHGPALPGAGGLERHHRLSRIAIRPAHLESPRA
jgi:hypothetical protein